MHKTSRLVPDEPNRTGERVPTVPTEPAREAFGGDSWNGTSVLSYKFIDYIVRRGILEGTQEVRHADRTADCPDEPDD